MIYKLFKILNQGSNNFSSIFGDIKKGPKGVIKAIVMGLLLLYCFAVMIGMYTVYMIGTYRYLASSGTQQFMPFITMMVALMVIMFFGFTSVASTYYTGTGEEFLMSLPLTPGQFFGAKFAVSFVSDAIMGVGMFAISSIVYGYCIFYYSSIHHLCSVYCDSVFYSGSQKKEGYDSNCNNSFDCILYVLWFFEFFCFNFKYGVCK